MLSKDHGKKIKNDKIMRRRIELSTYDFDIKCRCGEEDVPADTLSRMKCVKLNLTDLYELHDSLCHLGVTRMAHFVQVRNLPFSVDEIRQMIRSCKTCSELKPQYFSPHSTPLIKATQPFERLNTDFKGPCLVTTKISTS